MPAAEFIYLLELLLFFFLFFFACSIVFNSTSVLLKLQYTSVAPRCAFEATLQQYMFMYVTSVS